VNSYQCGSLKSKRRSIIMAARQVKDVTEQGFLFWKRIQNNYRRDIAQIEIHDADTQPFTTWRNFVKDVNVQKDRVGPSKGQNCFWQKLSKVCASTTGYSIRRFFTTSEIMPHYRNLFRHQLTRSRKVSTIIWKPHRDYLINRTILLFLEIYRSII